MLPGDSHVHSEWSWDAAAGSMERTCARAVAIGLPAVAFTEHADFTPWRTAAVKGRVPWGQRVIAPNLAGGQLDVDGYWDCLERCRDRFPGLRILSGVELGEAHRFAAETAAVLARRPFERVLGSVHCIPHGEALVDVSTRGFLRGRELGQRMRAYLAETLALVERSPVFAVLAHLTYPQRYWPTDAPPWSPLEFEPELRSILGAAAAAGLALEVNTTRGRDPVQGRCPPAPVLRWWHEAGGAAVSLGSDAHDPTTIAAGFGAAAEIIEGAGFRRPGDPADFWLR